MRVETLRKRIEADLLHGGSAAGLTLATAISLGPFAAFVADSMGQGALRHQQPSHLDRAGGGQDRKSVV